MIGRVIRSESGFGLIQAVAALFIATIAIAGLFMASYIARHHAISNYHYRVALLKGVETLEIVKFWSDYYGGIHPAVNSATIGSFVIDDEDGEIVKGEILPLEVSSAQDRAISNYVWYDRVRVTITWYDGPQYFANSQLNTKKQLVLVEDYFYRSDQVVP